VTSMTSLTPSRARCRSAWAACVLEGVCDEFVEDVLRIGAEYPANALLASAVRKNPRPARVCEVGKLVHGQVKSPPRG